MSWISIYYFIVIVNSSLTISMFKRSDDTSGCFIQINGSSAIRNNLNHSKDDDLSEDAPTKNTIQVVFTFPYSFSRESILNQTVVITNTFNNRILPLIIDICINDSSFVISYSTNQSLPHNVCLFLLFNQTITLREIVLCRTINLKSSLIPSDDHSAGPSAIFIILQCVIIVIMMCMIAAGHRAREKHILSRLCRCFPRKKSNNEMINETEFISRPIEQLVLAATDLTTITTDQDRKYTNHTLIDITEFTKRLSETSQNIQRNQF